MHFVDQMGRGVELPSVPLRIISLVPSQTELLATLGLENEIVGITKFCVHPEEWFRSKDRVGGTKKLNIGKIKQINPDLIVGNKEENSREEMEELMLHFPVWMSDVKNLEDALNMIQSLGEITGKAKKADEILEKIKTGFAQLRTPNSKLRTAYLIWKNPWMSVGGNTFISDMMTRCGLKNIFENHPGRYPEINLDVLKSMDPSLILLSSEPYPFREKHFQELKKEFPGSKVMLADGQMFSWYGSRLLFSPGYFSTLINNF